MKRVPERLDNRIRPGGERFRVPPPPPPEPNSWCRASATHDPDSRPRDQTKARLGQRAAAYSGHDKRLNDVHCV